MKKAISEVLQPKLESVIKSALWGLVDNYLSTPPGMQKPDLAKLIECIAKSDSLSYAHNLIVVDWENAPDWADSFVLHGAWAGKSEASDPVIDEVFARPEPTTDDLINWLVSLDGKTSLVWEDALKAIRMAKKLKGAK